MTTVTEQFQERSAQCTRQSRRHQLLGASFVVLSTAAIAIVPTFAKLAYDGGSDTLTVIAGRSIVTATVCVLVTIILGRPLRMPCRSLAISMGLGLLYAAHLYGLLGAVAHMPVNMAVLIYFFFPPLDWVGALIV